MEEPDYKLGMLPSSPLVKRAELHREQLEELCTQLCQGHVTHRGEWLLFPL